jgi:hypothetical protein
LIHLGALGKVGAYRTGDGQGQHTGEHSQDRRPARGEAQALIGPLLGGFGDLSLDGFDDVLLQGSGGVSGGLRRGL